MSQRNHKHGGSQKSAGNKQRAGVPGQQKKNAPEPRKSKSGVILVAAALLLVVAVVFVTSQGDGTKGRAALQADPDEARYMGRLLPAGYQAPSVADQTTYTAVVQMTELSATLGETQITVPLADVTNAKLALFQYEAGDLPIIAYVKPSGTLFVGVSYCPPCQGEWQTIQADGTLTCNACGTKRELETMVGISGPCKLYPLDELPVTILDGNIVIERGVLDSWTPQPLDRKIG